VSVSYCRSASLVGLSWGAYASPPLCPAPFPGEVRRLALSAGASFLCLRPSERSFSRWVVVVFFSSGAAAAAFAAPVAGLFPSGSFSRVPFCAVRRCRAWWCVSVPCSVAVFPPVAGVCPCFWAALS